MMGVSITRGSQTLTLFEGRKSRFDTLFKARTSNKGPFKIALLNLKTCIQACSSVLINCIFFVLRVGVVYYILNQSGINDNMLAARSQANVSLLNIHTAYMRVN